MRGGRWLLLSSAVEILSCRSWPEKDSLNPRFHNDDLPTDCDLVRPLRPRKMSSIVIHRLPPFFNSRPLGKYSLTAALSENILSQPSSRKSAWRYSLIDLDFTRAISLLPRNYLAKVSITPHFISIFHFSILPLSSPPPMPSPPPNTGLPLRICKAKKKVVFDALQSWVTTYSAGDMGPSGHHWRHTHLLFPLPAVHS